MEQGKRRKKIRGKLNYSLVNIWEKKNKIFDEEWMKITHPKIQIMIIIINYNEKSLDHDSEFKNNIPYENCWNQQKNIHNSQ